MRENICDSSHKQKAKPLNQILAGRGAANFWARLLGRLWREDGLSNGAGGRGGEVEEIFRETEMSQEKVSKG